MVSISIFHTLLDLLISPRYTKNRAVDNWFGTFLLFGMWYTLFQEGAALYPTEEGVSIFPLKGAGSIIFSSQTIWKRRNFGKISYVRDTWTRVNFLSIAIFWYEKSKKTAGKRHSMILNARSIFCTEMRSTNSCSSICCIDSTNSPTSTLLSTWNPLMGRFILDVEYWYVVSIEKT